MKNRYFWQQWNRYVVKSYVADLLQSTVSSSSSFSPDLNNFKDNYINIIPSHWKGKIFVLEIDAQIILGEYLSKHKTNLINDIEMYKKLKKELFKGPTCKKRFIYLTATEIKTRLEKVFI